MNTCLEMVVFNFSFILYVFQQTIQEARVVDRKIKKQFKKFRWLSFCKLQTKLFVIIFYAMNIVLNIFTEFYKNTEIPSKQIISNKRKIHIHRKQSISRVGCRKIFSDFCKRNLFPKFLQVLKVHSVYDNPEHVTQNSRCTVLRTYVQELL